MLMAPAQHAGLPAKVERVLQEKIPELKSVAVEKYQYRAAIDGKEEQIVTHHQMMVDMKIMEAAFTSDRTGMPVDVELKF